VPACLNAGLDPRYNTPPSGYGPGHPFIFLDIVIVLIRYKLVVLSLVLVLLGTGCSNEIKKKDTPPKKSDTVACTQTGGDKFLCLETALQVAEPATACAPGADVTLCGKSRFLNDGYGGFVYPQPIVAFFNTLYGRYVSYYYGLNNALPGFRHFGELFGLIYNDNTAAKTPTDIAADLRPVGIVAGGTVTSGSNAGKAYDSESCALCHFGFANDGFYRFGVPSVHLKYGGLKLAFNRFVCYAEAKAETNYATVAERCKASVDLTKLGDEEQLECKAYQAFLTSTGNATLLALWNNKAVVPDDIRTQMLDDLRNSVQDSPSACAAVGQLLSPYSYDQIVELSKWDGIRKSNTTIVDAEASRIDRFYHTVTTADSSQLSIDDGVHAPVKIPLLGNLVSDEDAAAQIYNGQFLGSGAVSSLQHYVRLHAALVGGNNAAAEVQDAELAPLMNFLASLKLPAPEVSATTLESKAYLSGQSLFVEKGCASSSCHDVTPTLNQPLVKYDQTVGTDYIYASALAVDSAPRSLIDSWNDVPQGLLKTPRLQGLWTYQAFLHNGMSHSLENLFCLTGNLDIRIAKDSNGLPIHEAPFLDSGHPQTCTDLTETQRRDLITYLLTL